MIDYHNKIFIGIEFIKKNTWKWNIIYFNATVRVIHDKNSF